MIELKTIGKIVIPKDVQDIIDSLHRLVGAKEWSGILFYEKTSGDVKNMKDLVFTAKFIYPMDIGSTSYTEHDYSGDLINAYDLKEGLESCNTGIIHSHHSMGSFFSGTDTSELKDNAKNFNFYLSLIVNFDGKYCCKVAFPSKTTTTEIHTIKNEEGKDILLKTEKDDVSIIIGDIDVETNIIEIEEEKWISDRIKELSKPKTIYYHNMHDDDYGYGHQGVLNYGNSFNHKTVTNSFSKKKTAKEKEEEEIKDFVISCMLGEIAESGLYFYESVDNFESEMRMAYNYNYDKMFMELIDRIETVYDFICDIDTSIEPLSVMAEKGLECLKKKKIFFNKASTKTYETLCNAFEFHIDSEIIETSKKHEYKK